MESAHAQLGGLVRSRRDQAGLSQQALATAAGVSRETVNRLERATGKWEPHPTKTAQVLGVLGITPDEARHAITDDEFYEKLAREMTRVSTAQVIEFVHRKAAQVPAGEPANRTDIVLITPTQVTCLVSVVGRPHTAAEVRRQLAEALGELGWIVSVPVN